MTQVILTNTFIYPGEIAAKCLACPVRFAGICAALSSDELNEVGLKTTRRKFTAGTPIFFEGDDVLIHGNIVTGVVHLSKGLSDGRQQIVALQFSPTHLPVKTARVTAQAATDSEICAIPNSLLNEIVGSNAKVEETIYKQTLDEVDETRHRMRSIGRKTAFEKIANLILMFVLKGDPGAGNGYRFELPLTRSEIADFLGLTVETVSRKLTKLRATKIIRIDSGRSVTLNSLSRLHDVSGC